MVRTISLVFPVTFSHQVSVAIDAGKIERDLGWKPAETFATGLRKTVTWYLTNGAWVQAIKDGKYRGERLGTTGA